MMRRSNNRNQRRAPLLHINNAKRKYKYSLLALFVFGGVALLTALTMILMTMSFLQVHSMAMQQQSITFGPPEESSAIIPSLPTKDDDNKNADTTNKATTTQNNVVSLSQQQQQQQQQKRRRRPMLILHVGPMKTASTTIQDACTRYHAVLRSDNYYYLGKINSEYSFYFNDSDVGDDVFRNFLYRCYNAEFYDAQKCEIERASFRTILQEHLDVGHNIIASDEALSVWDIGNSDSGWNMLEETFRGFDVKIVLAYRRYHEWLLSLYRHVYYPAVYHPYMMVFPDDENNGGGAVVPSFAEFARNAVMWWKNDTANNNVTPPTEEVASVIDSEESRATIGLRNEHVTIHAYKMYREHFDDVIILNHHPLTHSDSSIGNTHKRSGVLMQLMCDVLPNATQTCALFGGNRNEEVISEKVILPSSYISKSIDVAYEIIVQRAHELYPNLAHISRRDLFKKVYMEGQLDMHVNYSKCRRKFPTQKASCPKTDPGLPMICDMEDIVKSMFLNQTRKFEEEVIQLPGFLYAEGMSLSTLEKSFAEAVHSMKFCSVDTNKLFRGRWGSVLSKI